MIQIECCDNLELMSKIESGTVDLIYCDILYGTGRKFADYQDLKPIRSEIESHYIPRIKEMHRILKPTGSIYLQMDTKINHWIRCLMDEVFGYGNFRNEIIWFYPSMSPIKNKFVTKHDNILYYAKSKTFTFNVDSIRDDYDEKTIKRYENKVLFPGGYEAKKNELGKVPYDVWDMKLIRNVSKEKVGYFSQKPKALVERIIKASSNEGDTVADYYLGSGTTAVVCKELNRNFIGCDINPKAIEITNARLDAVS